MLTALEERVISLIVPTMDSPTILAHWVEMLMYFVVRLQYACNLNCIFIAVGVGASSCTTGDVRLAGGSNDYEGRVEVCVNQAWSSVCTSSGWNRQAAQVVCNQLGDDLGI